MRERERHTYTERESERASTQTWGPQGWSWCPGLGTQAPPSCPQPLVALAAVARVACPMPSRE